MNVLSLFDGISCGQLALQRAEVKVDKYFASEIDKYAIKVTQENFPETVQLGDVTKWETWELPNIDLLIGGSPCQGFSFAGKQLNFSDPRSKLFFEYVKVLRKVKPKYFLLENVKMKQEYQDVISRYLGVEPIEINSSLVSAQNRKRLYWTNIPNVTQPEDKGMLLKDIIEADNGYCGVTYNKKENNVNNFFMDNINSIESKQKFGKESQSLSRALKSTRALDEKSECLLASMYKGPANNGATNVIINDVFRMITPLECERLQTVPDNYTSCISNTQRYKCLGNGWTVDVIAHILGGVQMKTLEKLKESGELCGDK